MASGDSKSGVAPNTLVGMGNPLLDLQATVGKDFLDKWGLKENDAILSDEKHIGIFDDLAANYHVEYVPGGATQNAMRVCQWILNEPGRVAFFGAIGNDKFGDTLREKATSAGVNVRYQVNNVKPGTCAALINGAHRSLVADLAAANTFTVEHLDIPENAAIIENAKFYYIAGFFLTVCPPAIQRVAKGAAAANKPFMMNLAAPFIPSFFFEPLSDALPYVDILFGNEEEALAFSKRAGYETTDMHEIARKIAAIEKVNKQRQRIVILTQGGNPIIVVEGDKTREFPVDKLPLEKIVDTNGAGDAFCGGFLAQYIRGRSFEESMECGNYAASAIIQQNGCTFPPSCKYH